MKYRLFPFLSILPFSLAAQTDTVFTINGELENISDKIEWVFLSYRPGRQIITDSSLVQNNHYSFKGIVTQPIKGTLLAQYKAEDGEIKPMVYQRDAFAFILESGNIRITSLDSFANAKVEAGMANKEYIKLQEQLKPYNVKKDQLWERYDEAEANNDKVKMKEYERAVDETDSTLKEDVYRAYLLKNSSSPLAFYVLQVYAGVEIDPAKVEPLYNKIVPSICGCGTAKLFYDRVQIAKQTAIGMPAMDFEQKDTAGKIVTLSSFKGKYVLLNFWASWCPHCARENPELVTVYNKYKDRTFTILSVSLDKPGEKENWIQAIRATHLEWTHVSDLKEWENSIAVQYGISAIPQNFLIDPKGTIIARNITPEMLDEKLREILLK